MNQRQLNRQGKAYIVGGQNTVKQLWQKMCEEDGVPTDSKFVTFSDNNKYAPFYDKAVAQLREAMAQYRDGGYVGLRIVGQRR